MQSAAKKSQKALDVKTVVATALLKPMQWQHDVQGKEVGLHDVRTKDGAEVDFALSEQAPVDAVQVVRHLRHSHTLGEIRLARADAFLNGLVA